MKRFIALLLSVFTIMSIPFSSGCGEKTETGEIEIIEDSNWSNGFILTGFNSTQVGNRPAERDIGRINFDTVVEKPTWRIGQWGCLKNLAYPSATRNFVNGWDIFRDDSTDYSKELKLNRATGEFSLNVAATKDGIYADGPRTANEPWIHFILEIPSFNRRQKVSELEYLTFYLEFMLNKSENHNGDDYDTNLHSAMFLWYVTLRDCNNGDYMWFGLPIYDNRHTYSPEYAMQDGGKEDSTDKFIFNPAADGFLDLPVTAGIRNVLNKDMLPTIEKAFGTAKERGFLKNSAWEDMEISLMYIGWELPGTFDVGMDVYAMKLLGGLKK